MARSTVLLAFLCLSPAGVFGDGPEVIPLWPKGAPGFESRRGEPELAKDYWVKNIHNPSITVFLPPKGKGDRCRRVDLSGRRPSRAGL